MERLDREISQVLSEKPASGGPARLLVVGGTAGQQQMIIGATASKVRQCDRAADHVEARTMLARRRYDVMLLSAALTEGDTDALLQNLPRYAAATRTIVFGEANSFNEAIHALRRGAFDFVNLSTELDQLPARVEEALRKSRSEQQRDEMLTRLKRICKELNLARHEVSDQVESLCQELSTAYTDMAERIEEVTMATEFKTLARQELDVEDLLRTFLEYLLTKTGPTNAAVFLPDTDGSYNLGAYVNYDCPRENVTALLDHLCGAICPQMEDEDEIVAFTDAREFGEWIGLETDLLGTSEVIAFTCRHESECMAVIVLFRSNETGFAESLACALDVLRQIFADQLAHLIRIHHRAKAAWPEEAMDDELDIDDFGFGLGGGGVAA